jgi:RNase P subunit RPR2
MNKKEAESEIDEFFKSRQAKEKVRKIKKLAASFQIKLKDKRKKFCKKCNSMNLKTKSIKRKIKAVICEDCGNIMRWKMAK